MNVPVLEVINSAADERRSDCCDRADCAEVDSCARLDVRGFDWGRDRCSEGGAGGGGGSKGDDGGRTHDDWVT